jgi:hypothetical protein
MFKRIISAAVVAGAAFAGFGAVAGAAPSDVVPGQQGRDGVVTGHYAQTVVYEGVTYDYKVNFRGDFGGDPYLDNGWITNNIVGDDGSAAVYLFVHETDPRYSGDPDRAI